MFLHTRLRETLCICKNYIHITCVALAWYGKDMWLTPLRRILASSRSSSSESYVGVGLLLSALVGKVK